MAVQHALLQLMLLWTFCQGEMQHTLLQSTQVQFNTLCCRLHRCSSVHSAAVCTGAVQHALLQLLLLWTFCQGETQHTLLQSTQVQFNVLCCSQYRCSSRLSVSCSSAGSLVSKVCNSSCSSAVASVNTVSSLICSSVGSQHSCGWCNMLRHRHFGQQTLYFNRH